MLDFKDLGTGILGFFGVVLMCVLFIVWNGFLIYLMWLVGKWVFNLIF